MAQSQSNSEFREARELRYAPANYVPVPVIPMSVVQSNFTPMAMFEGNMRGMRWPAPQPGGQPVQPSLADQFATLSSSCGPYSTLSAWTFSSLPMNLLGFGNVDI